MKLKELYKNDVEIRNAIYSATDKTEKDCFIARHRKLIADIKKEESQAFTELFWAYRDSMNNGNDVLNIDDDIKCDVQEFIAEMNKNEITEFTFTSTWSSATEVIAAFINAGFTIQKTAQICICKTEWNEEFKTGLVFQR